MESFVFGLATASTAMAGGLWVASRSREWLNPERLEGLMALGGGLLMAGVLFELLPESIEQAKRNAFYLLFAGVLAVLLFERYLAPRLTFLNPPHAEEHADCPLHGHGHHHEGPHEGHDAHDHSHEHIHAHHSGTLLSHGAACSALGCLLVCTFFDGVAMAASFNISTHVGLLVGLGLAFHILPEGLLASAVVLASGNSKKWARRAAFATGASIMLGMLVPSVIGGVAGTAAYALPVAAGVLLYVVLVQMVPLALRSAKGVPLLIVGAAIFEVIERFIPHTH